MHEVTSQRSKSPNITRTDDERSPLLPKVAVSSVQQCGTDDDLSTHTLSAEISAAKLRWIMTSVWIGTFCAGLGTPFYFSSWEAQREQKREKLLISFIQTQVSLPLSDRQLPPNSTRYRFSHGLRLRIS